jgi:putative hydrolase of the HAD superfamily
MPLHHGLGRIRPSRSRDAGHGPVWLLDLDNTLHDASHRLMAEINRRMTDYIMSRLGLSREQASERRQRYWRRYGATLLGLVAHDGIDATDFLHQTHPDDDLLDHLLPVRGQSLRLRRLRGRHWLLTNAPRQYAWRVLRFLGLDRQFERIICVEDMRAIGRLRPKPSPWLWRRLVRLTGRPAGQVILVDDSTDNLRGAHRAGLRTARVWASAAQRAKGWSLGRPPSAQRPVFAHHQVNCLSSLARLGDSVRRRAHD